MNANANPAQDGVVLSGLDGSNPLAFLAALGTLRTLTLVWPEHRVQMRWIDHTGAWRPMILATPPHIAAEGQSQRIFVQHLHEQLIQSFTEHPLAVLSELPHVALQKVREWFTEQVQATTHLQRDRGTADWISAMSSEQALDATSQLQTVRRDYFLGNLRNVVERTQAADLERCLFQQWDYADSLENQSLHFEPTEDRRHAYQWNKPSGDPDRKKRGGMLGANRLAIEAFPFFQSVALGRKLSTRGFSGTRANHTRWTWPIWSGWLACHTVSSLIALPELQLEEPAVHALRSRGICAAFRCRRILVEKTPNFTAATAVL